MTKWSDVFTDRQLIALTTFADLERDARERAELSATEAGCREDRRRIQDGGNGPVAYAESIATYLSFSVSKAADRNSSLCVWESQMDRLRGTFGRQALPMVWDFVETNPFAGAGGDLYGMPTRYVKQSTNS